MNPTLPQTNPPLEKSFNKKPGLIIAILILLFLVIVVVKAKVLPSNFSLNNQTPSANILYLTQPVYSVTGKIEKINNNNIVVSDQVVSSPTTSTLGGPVAPPSTKTLTFQVDIGNKTVIGSPTPPILLAQPPASGSAVPTKPSMTIKDLRVGETVMVTSSMDLRTLQGEEFEATTVIPLLTTSLSGTIVNVSANTITIKSISTAGPTPTSSSQAQSKNYTMAIDANTNISKITPVAPTLGGTVPPSPPVPTKLSPSDLKNGDQVNIITNDDINFSTNLRAVIISVLPTITPPIPTPNSASSSGNLP